MEEKQTLKTIGYLLYPIGIIGVVFAFLGLAIGAAVGGSTEWYTILWVIGFMVVPILWIIIADGLIHCKKHTMKLLIIQFMLLLFWTGVVIYYGGTDLIWIPVAAIIVSIFIFILVKANEKLFQS